MKKDIMTLEYYDKINNKDYYVEFDVNLLINIENELIAIKNIENSNLGKITINRLTNCINELINGNSEVLDILFYQNKFSNNYSEEINRLELLSVEKIKNEDIDNIIHNSNNVFTNYNSLKEKIDLLKKKEYYDETLYREYLLKILSCLKLTIKEEKNLKKLK